MLCGAKCRNECLKTQYWNIGNDAEPTHLPELEIHRPERSRACPLAFVYYSEEKYREIFFLFTTIPYNVHYNVL